MENSEVQGTKRKRGPADAAPVPSLQPPPPPSTFLLSYTPILTSNRVSLLFYLYFNSSLLLPSSFYAFFEVPLLGFSKYFSSG
jgi:hypothetical protein